MTNTKALSVFLAFVLTICTNTTAFAAEQTSPVSTEDVVITDDSTRQNTDSFERDDNSADSETPKQEETEDSDHQAADSVVIPTTYGDNDLDATVELFVPVLRQINETAKLIFAPNRINESKAQFKEEAKRNRDKAWNKVHTYGSLVARIKDSIVFDNSRFNTIDPLNHWQANGVMHCFDEIYKELK